jgi:hypothetical protein
MNPVGNKTKAPKCQWFAVEDMPPFSPSSIKPNINNNPTAMNTKELLTKTQQCQDFVVEKTPPYSTYMTQPTISTPSAMNPNVHQKTKYRKGQESVEEETLPYSPRYVISSPPAKKIHSRKTKTTKRTPSFRSISIFWACLLLALLRVVGATDCGKMSTWLPEMFNATGIECCFQTGITCVNDSITEM